MCFQIARRYEGMMALLSVEDVLYFRWVSVFTLLVIKDVKFSAHFFAKLL